MRRALREDALDEHAREVAQVGRRGVQVPGRVDGCGGLRSGFARGLRVRGCALEPELEQRRPVGRPRRPRPALRRQCRSRPAPSRRQARARSRRGAGRTPRSATAAALRPDRLHDELVGLERGREVRDEEVVGARSSRLVVTTEPPSTSRQSGSSAAASAWAIEPPTVPRLRVTKWPTRGSASAASGTPARSPWRTVAPTRRAVDPVEPGDAVDVDEHGRADEPHVQQRHEALPAGEHLRLVAVLGQQRDRLLDGLGTLVAERRGLHGRISSHTRAGVSGSSTSSTPSASATALAIATGARHRVALAEPLRAERRERRRRLAVRRFATRGRSGAVGQR